MSRRHLIPLWIILFVPLPQAVAAAPAAAADVVVYGETLAGIGAAIQAARLGRAVVLLAQTAHFGGVATAGLTATDMNRSASIARATPRLPKPSTAFTPPASLARPSGLSIPGFATAIPARAYCRSSTAHSGGDPGIRTTVARPTATW